MPATDSATSVLLAPRDSYLWTIPGQAVAVEIDYDVIDRLGEAVQREWDARRETGREAGGILLGAVLDGNAVSIRIEDFEPVPCGSRNGTAYAIGELDRARWEQALARWRPGQGRRLRAVGFYRGHQRSGLGLDGDDRKLMDRYFPDDAAVALLVKPSAAGTPRAGLFVRENGGLRGGSSRKEFPFRREELGGAGGEEPWKAPRNGTVMMQRFAAAEAPGFRLDTGLEQATHSTAPDIDQAGHTVVPKRTLRLRGGWVWIPLSFVFLLLGTVIGFQVALSVRSNLDTTVRTPGYELALTATPSADSIQLRWDRNAPAIQNATGGALLIQEDGREKRVDLDAGHLRNGTVIYRRASDDVAFRLEVFLEGGLTVSQSVDFRPVAPKNNAN